MVIIVATTSEEIKEAFAWLSENSDAITIVKADEQKKQKKSEYDKQRYESKKNSTVKTVNETKEEREEKEEALPPSPPLPFSPLTPYPITPYTPPLPEEKEEREENYFGGAPEKRGELREFGPHVRLSEEEFLKLQEKFGQAETTKMIRAMNDYIGEDSKLVKKYQTRNHYLTLLNWQRRDEKKTQVKPQPKQESWTEVAERLEREQNYKQEIIDL